MTFLSLALNGVKPGGGIQVGESCPGHGHGMSCSSTRWPGTNSLYGARNPTGGEDPLPSEDNECVNSARPAELNVGIDPVPDHDRPLLVDALQITNQTASL